MSWHLKVLGALFLSGLLVGDAIAATRPRELHQARNPELNLSHERLVAQRLPDRDPLVFEGELNQDSLFFNSTESYLDRYKFTGRAGDTVRIDLVSDDFDPYLFLLDPDNRRIVEDNDSGDDKNASIVVVLPLDGEYTIWASTHTPEEVGNYRLTVQRVTPDDGDVAQTNLNLAPVISQRGISLFEGELSAESRVFESDGSYFNVHTFTGQAGEAIQIDLVSNEFDAHLLLVGPDSNRLRGDDNGGDYQNSRILFTLPRDGEYEIWANSRNPGEVGQYRLALQGADLDDAVITSRELPPELQALIPQLPQAGALAFTGELNGKSKVLDFDRSYFDPYTVVGQAGETVQIDLESDDFDPYLILLEPNSGIILEDNNSGDNNNARITVTLPLDGEYIVRANSSQAGEVGRYRLTSKRLGTAHVISERSKSPKLSQHPEFPQFLGKPDYPRYFNWTTSLDQGWTYEGQYFDTYTIFGHAGKTIKIDLESDEFEPQLILIDPLANRLLEDDDGGEGKNASATVTLPMDGEYRVLIHSPIAPEGRGVYRLTFREQFTDKTRETLAQAQQLVREGKILRLQETVESWQAAIEAWEAAIPLYQSIGDRVGEANTLHDIAGIHSGLGDNQQALDYYNRALPLFQAVRDQQGAATALNNIGAIYNALGDNQRALEVFQQALPLFQAVSDRLSIANTLNNIGAIYNALGDNQQALDYYDQALPLLKAVGAELSEADALVSKGRIGFPRMPNLSQSERESKWQASFESYEQAMRIYRDVGDRGGEDAIISNIRWFYKALGYEGIAEGYSRGGTIPEEVAPEFQRQQTIVLNDLDGLRNGSEEQQRALDYYNQAQLVAEAIADRQAESIALQNIGRIYHHRGDQQRALDYYNQALSPLKSTRDWRTRAIIFDNMGQAHNTLGETPQAIDLFEQALALRQKAGDINGEAATLWNMANMQRDQGQLSAALVRIQDAIAIVEKLRSLTPPGELRQTYFATVQNYYQFQLDLLMELQQQNPNSRENYAAQALQVSESIRARTLIEQLTEASLDIRQGVPPNLLAQEQALIKQLNAAEQQRIAILKTSYSNAQLNAVKAQTEQTLQQLKDVESRIRQASPAYAQLNFPDPLTLKEIQNQILDDDTLLLEYALGEEQSYLFLVSKTGLQTYTLPPQAEIEAAVEAYRDKLQDRAFTDLSQGQALSEMLLGQVAEKLGNKRLLVVSNGKLQLLPFGALPIPKTSQGASVAPLLANHEIITLPSATSLAVQRRQWQNRPKASKTVAVIADPVFQANDDRFTGDRPIVTEQQDLAVALGLRTGCTDFSRLPYTATEAQEILDLVPDAQEFSAIGFDANHNIATDSNLNQYQILHLATHGCIQDDARLSGLALSFYDQEGDETENTSLKLQDIYNLELNAELVVLSACQTGIGENVAGEGVVGLTSGFLYAGAKRVVVSLWNVNDRATADLMSDYYRRMLEENRDPHQGLRQAQLAMWESQEFRAPFYWAAFTMQGEF